jgi:hypothetical protein
MTSRLFLHLTLIIWVCWSATISQAQQEFRISKLTNVDREFMAQQRTLLQDLAARNLGRQFQGQRDRDLDLLQSLLDKRVVRPEQTRELQAMGLIMGDLLATELDMHWVIYEDRVGRSRALRYKESDDFLFPMTMISRRREAGNQARVTDIYQKAYDIIAERKPALPFQ